MFRSLSKGRKRKEAEKKEKEREKEREMKKVERVEVKKGDGKPAPTFEEMRAFLIGNATEEEMDLLWSISYKPDRIIEINSPYR